jgi:hypothetical protein
MDDRVQVALSAIDRADKMHKCRYGVSCVLLDAEFGVAFMQDLVEAGLIERDLHGQGQFWPKMHYFLTRKGRERLAKVMLGVEQRKVAIRAAMADKLIFEGERHDH